MVYALLLMVQVYGFRFMVYGLWFAVCRLWSMVFGSQFILWFLSCVLWWMALWSVAYDLGFMVYGV